MFGLGIKELVIIALVVLLLFSLTKLPDLIKSIAASIKIVKQSFGDKKKGTKK